MEEIKNIILCGLGAIGSIYAVNFSQYDNNILKILVDKKRFEKYKQEPLIFNGKEYNFNYITPDTIENKADLIIIATKNNGLDEAICNIKNCVGEKTVILSLLKISLNKYAKKRKANAVLNESALQLIPSYKAIGKSPENRKGYLKIGVILIAIEIKIIYISKLHNLPK